MENIVIPVSSLLNLAKELDADGMEYVELSASDPQEIDGETIPASLLASGFRSSMPSVRTDYADIEHIPDLTGH